MREDESLIVPDSEEGDAVKNVHEVLKRIKEFSDNIRNHTIKGYTGKNLVNTLVIGIGGSYLGPEFVFEALKQDDASKKAAAGRRLKFLANVDPVDFHRAMEDLDIEETLVVINSKTFTTAETMLNAKTVRNYIIEHYKKTHPQEQDHSKFVEAHMCAVSTNLPETKKFGVKDERVFGFWDWVGGRFSVCSAVGVLPMALHYGFENVNNFLHGAKSIDDHLRNTKDMTKNLPLLLGLIGFYNTYIAGHATRTILPYCQSLLKFPAHIQQLDMESNGKSVTRDGTRFGKGIETGPIIFGEPGTNGQHSFYQLMHQGRVIPGEFIGFVHS
jgi:glucose-6-phosphate isomerase